MKAFIEALEDYQRAGLDFVSEEVDKSDVKTQTGVKTVLVRRREYIYNLTLQDLTNTQVKALVALLEAKENTRPYSRIVIPVNLFTGYIGKGVNDIQFNFDSDKMNTDENEQGWTIVLPVQEIEVL